MTLYEFLRRGATLDAAPAGAGVDLEMAAIMVDHYERAGLLEPTHAAPCTDCSPRRLGCAGCPFAGVGSRNTDPSGPPRVG